MSVRIVKTKIDPKNRLRYDKSESVALGKYIIITRNEDGEGKYVSYATYLVDNDTYHYSRRDRKYYPIDETEGLADEICSIIGNCHRDDVLRAAETEDNED